MDTTSMKADAMREKLKTYPDFKNQKTILEEYIERRGHLCLFYPKFHCELSPIERVWCHSKKHTRAYANGSIIRLRQLVPKGLNSVTTEMIKKFFRTCRDYECAYREGLQGKAVEEKVKLYKSHKCVNSRHKSASKQLVNGDVGDWCLLHYTLTLLTCLHRALNHAPLVHVHVIISKLYNSGT